MSTANASVYPFKQRTKPMIGIVFTAGLMIGACLGVWVMAMLRNAENDE